MDFNESQIQILPQLKTFFNNFVQFFQHPNRNLSQKSRNVKTLIMLLDLA